MPVHLSLCEAEVRRPSRLRDGGIAVRDRANDHDNYHQHHLDDDQHHKHDEYNDHGWAVRAVYLSVCWNTVAYLGTPRFRLHG